jgi:non-lysosomal glucosylceramidase
MQIINQQCRCSGGRCGDPQPMEVSRRDFLESLAASSGGLALLSTLPSLAEGGQRTLPTLPKPSTGPSYPRTPARVYRGGHLDAVGMPVGGIGTGSIWLDGHGRLSIWQIFNNLSEPRVPDSFFAVRTRAGSGPAVTRVLQTVAEASLQPMASLSYEGGYPIARLTFQDPALPVEVSLDAFNPMIPLDAANSSIPCAVFRFTAKNAGSAAAEVELFAALQNAVGNLGTGNPRGVHFDVYGGNRNRTVREDGLVAVAMDKSLEPMLSGPIKVRAADGKEVHGPEILWLAAATQWNTFVADPLARIAAEGGVALVDGTSPQFFTAMKKLRAKRPDLSSVGEVFEDLEKDIYEGWTLTGNAFGKGPAHGTLAGQQPVSGFAGHGLINTFVDGDGPQGTATSKKFTIGRRYIGFLIGGGSQAGKTCINLRVGSKVVRTATGKDHEALLPASWDVADLKGKEAVIEIVDRSSDPWGHINIDQIIFSDMPPEPFLRSGTTLESAAKAIRMVFDQAEAATLPAGQKPTLADSLAATVKPASSPWNVSQYTRLAGFRDGAAGYRALASTADGNPLVIAGPLGKGRVVLVLAPGLPWNWGSAMMLAARGKPLDPGQRLVPGAPGIGTMALVALDAKAAALPGWTTAGELAAWIADPVNKDQETKSPPGATVNAALCVPLSVPPGESRIATFAITWHFPNVQRFQHAGNLYSRRWPDATHVARYLAAHFEPLRLRTELYRQTLYESNLPEEFLDAMSSQSVILRGPTCFWSEDGYFGGFEGSYGCCPLNCTHVWNYAQSHARLFPEVGQNMRISNFVTYLHETGETSHREHAPHEAFIDGHSACIEAALREYQLSPDRRFLEMVWPGVKKAVDWLIKRIDSRHEGMPVGHQWNTYDTAVSGENTFIGSQYLSALAAGERMARIMQDDQSAKRWRAVLDAGMKNQDHKLWNGQYYIQIPDPKPARDYDTGCHADQLLGQWWAHMLNLGYLYPRERVKSALASVMRHNFRADFTGFRQSPRRYVEDGEGGLIICTWPNGGRPKDFILYADEVWTGIEYAAAGAMIFEGLIAEARQIVRTARARYDGHRREGLDSGPGGNPFNELECGKFYARAMSSWSLLIASQGLVLEGPKGILGFRPNWQPEDHRSFFTAPGGWGLFIQKRQDQQQTERIEVRHGQLRIKELAFALPNSATATATVEISGLAVAAKIEHVGPDVRVTLEQEATVPEGAAVEVVLRWNA